MKKLIKRIATITTEAGLFWLGFLRPVFGQGVDGGLQGGADAAAPTGAETDLFGPDGIFRTITNILVFLIGAVSVIMLIIGGFRYVLSGGDSCSVESAKNAILYDVIGIIVAFLAYAAVSFVLNSLNQ